MFVIANIIQKIAVIRILIFMFHLRYIGHTVYRLSTHTSAAAQKLITFIDVRSAMFAVMRWKITVVLKCDNMWLYYLSFKI